MNFILVAVAFIAGLLSGSIGFGGALVLLPVATYFFGIEIAIPTCTIAQMLSNLSRVLMGLKDVKWRSVGLFLITAAPLTALGAYGFTIAPKVLLTRILCVFLVTFAILKLMGKMQLPRKPATMLIGGGITGFINGLLGISGPLSSAVFLTLGLTPVSYIASEACAATVMHIIKAIVYGKLNLINTQVLTTGLGIAVAMIAGNFISMRLIRNIHTPTYQRIVAACMIALSIFMFITAH
jgi:uncharacterized membrane protein YfcA